MKNLMMIFSFVFGLATIAQAQAPSTVPVPQKPCKEIIKSCMSAPGNTTRQLRKECVKNVLSGTAVEGVSVSKDVVTACQAKKAAKQASKKS